MPRFSFSLDFNTLVGLLALVLWSASVALGRSLSEQLGPLTTAAAVYLIDGVFCLAVLGQKRRKVTAPEPPFSRLYLWGCGSLFALYMFAFYQALGLAADRLQVLEIGMINYLWPSLTILFSLLLLGHQAHLLLIPGTLLALGGIFLVLTHETDLSWTSFVHHLDANPLAYLLALVAALSWGLYSNLTRRWAGAGSRSAVPWFMFATGILLFFLRLSKPEPNAWTFRAGTELLSLALATALGYLGWDLAMRKGNVALVVACSYFTPLLSTLVSCAYLGIAASVRLWVGGLAIVAGSLISWVSIADNDTTLSPG